MDVVPYAAFLMLYLMLWITTSHMVIPAGLHYQFSFDALTTSIKSGIWNDYYYVFWIWLTAAGPLMAAVFLLLTAVVFVFLRVVVTAEIKYAGASMQSLGFVLLISACIVSPTVMLEAGFNVWTPGTRWPMLMQFSTPFAFCVVAFAIMSAVPNGSGGCSGRPLRHAQSHLSSCWFLVSTVPK